MVVYVGLQLLLAARNYILHTSVPSLVEVKFHILQKNLWGKNHFTVLYNLSVKFQFPLSSS